jgi:alanine racemase
MTCLDRPAWAEVDLAAIAHNVEGMKSLLDPGVELCAVVKADAYGHGAAPVAERALAAGAKRLAVAIVSEAVELREAGFGAPILVFGCAGRERARDMARLDLAATVYSLDEGRALSEAALSLGKRTKVHLKIDTGMARVGVAWEEAPAMALALSRMPGIELEGAYSHFASADSPDLSFAREQLARFMDALSRIEALGIRVPLRHMANSAAAIALPESRLDMVRPGIILYGLKPSPGMAIPFEPRPAMSLKARVSMVKALGSGVSVGYGRGFFTERPSLVATIPIGYADGWPRRLAGRASVALAGRRAPIVGRICMDQFMVDATGLADARAGDEAVLFGAGGPSIDEVAEALGSINYEVVCGVGKRIPRIYLGGGGEGADPALP